VLISESDVSASRQKQKTTHISTFEAVKVSNEIVSIRYVNRKIVNTHTWWFWDLGSKQRILSYFLTSNIASSLVYLGKLKPQQMFFQASKIFIAEHLQI